MGWGEARTPINGGAGTTGEIEDALNALAAMGVIGRNLAVAAIEAAGVIDRLRQREAEALMAHVRQEDTASGAAGVFERLRRGETVIDLSDDQVREPS